VRGSAGDDLVVVLQVNKFFHPRAGAETAFLQTRDLLGERGHEVVDFAMSHPANLASPYARHFAPSRSYDGDGRLDQRIRDAASSVYSPQARASLGALLDERRPDVAHLHNVYHQLTLSVVDELARRRVPMVLTLHDWKVACPAYTLFTEGSPCRRCVRGSVANAIVHRCVKGSALASGVAAVEAGLARHRGTYAKIQRFIAPSRFAVDVAGMAGIEARRIAQVPNFLTDVELSAAPAPGPREPVLLYAGRLDTTKGIRQLLAAFAHVSAPAVLRIAGSGELEDEVRAAAARDPRIDYLGRIERTELLAQLDRARAVVLPSIWEDNGPLAILEAQARGAALVVSDRGGLPEFVRDGESGLIVPAEDVVALAESMQRLVDDPDLAQRLGHAGRQDVQTEHNAARHYERLVSVYSEAISEVRRCESR
jgi:glycosyltransferase involved in cell wall biosynthesis